MLTEPVRN